MKTLRILISFIKVERCLANLMLCFHFLSTTGFPLQFTYLSLLHNKGYPFYLKMIQAYLREYSDFLLENCEKNPEWILINGGKCNVYFILHRNEKPKT